MNLSEVKRNLEDEVKRGYALQVEGNFIKGLTFALKLIESFEKTLEDKSQTLSKELKIYEKYYNDSHGMDDAMRMQGLYRIERLETIDWVLGKREQL